MTFIKSMVDNEFILHNKILVLDNAPTPASGEVGGLEDFL